MYLKISDEMHYLWRAVDQEGEILESYVTKTRDKKAALAFIKKALKRDGCVETIATDGLRSYGAAMDKLGNREKRDRSLGEQPGREQPPALQARAADHDQVQADEITTEVRLSPCLASQSLRLGTPPN
jgi:transposase-like protein